MLISKVNVETGHQVTERSLPLQIEWEVLNETGLDGVHELNQVTNTSVTLQILAKLDTRVSGHFFKSSDTEKLFSNKQYHPGPTTILPNRETVRSTITGQLPFPNLTTGNKGYGFDGIKNSSLLSVNALFDNGWIAIFDRHGCKILIFLQDHRNPLERLWDIMLDTIKKKFSVNVVIRKDTTLSGLAICHNTSFVYPSCTTLNLKKNSFPSIERINRHTTFMQRKDTSNKNVRVSNL